MLEMKNDVRRLEFENEDQCLFIDCRMVMQRHAPDHSAMGSVPLHERACVFTKNVRPNTSYVERCGRLLWDCPLHVLA